VALRGSPFPAQGAIALPWRDFLWSAGLKAKLEAWRRFWNLSGHSRGVVIEAAVGLTATWIGLRVMGYGRWKRVLDGLVPETMKRASAGDSATLGSAQAIARFEQSAARHLLLRTNCLEQSLVLCWLLQRRGIPATLRIGARKHEGRFEAHAWVELNGTVLEQDQGQHLHFAAFDRPILPMEIETP
jgi:hypothetical protein